MGSRDAIRLKWIRLRAALPSPRRTYWRARKHTAAATASKAPQKTRVPTDGIASDKPVGGRCWVCGVCEVAVGGVGVGKCLHGWRWVGYVRMAMSGLREDDSVG